MAEEKKQIQDRVVNLYSDLIREKRQKNLFMRTVKRYVRPTRTAMLQRYSDQAQVHDPETLVDNTAGIAMSEYTVESLKSIQSMAEDWFTLLVPYPKKIDESLRQEYEAWAVENQKLLNSFITKSKYFLSLTTDNFFFNSYGFSGMTFGAKNKKLLVAVENPFLLYIVRNDQDIVGCMWERQYKADAMLREFNWKDEGMDSEESQDQKATMTYTVIHALLPNNDTYIKDPQKGSGKNFVQLFLLKDEGKAVSVVEDKREEITSIQTDEKPMTGVEIGERKHFSILPTVIPVDTKHPSEGYGYGLGEWVLAPATNSNRFLKNILSSSSMKARPPLEVPMDYHLMQDYLVPGQIFTRHPQTMGGQDSVKFVEFKDKLQEQMAVLDSEREQVRTTLPSVDSPPKKQRQSQYEIEKAQLNRMENMFAHKLPYLMEGVAEHLKRMFYIARDLKILTPLPKGLKWGDVEPSIENLIEKEKQRIKAQKYVVVATMSQAYLNNFLEGWDNFKKDNIIRNIALSQGVGSELHSIEERTKIRQERRKQEEQQQQHQLAMMQAERNLLDAKAAKESGQHAKLAVEAKQKEQEI